MVTPALAGIGAACRVPEPYLRFPVGLERTQQLIDLKRPIRVLVIGPAIEGSEVIEKRRSRLAEALAQRLPQATFELIDGWHASRVASEDFDRLRHELSDAQPDLVLWQVGTSDALAASDPEEFGGVLVRAAHWAKAHQVDFVLIDPPYLPQARREQAYGKMVGTIGAVSDTTRVDLFRRYAAMQYLDKASVRPGVERPHCMSELLAEAIMRAVKR